MLTEARLRRWLREVRSGRREISSVVRQLQRLPTDRLGFARLDTHRRLRRGVPEVIFCEGKTPDQIVRLTRRLLALDELVLLTRLNPEMASYVLARVPSIRYDALARIGYRQVGRSRRGLVAVVSAGTADLPVAAEAALSAELLGSRVQRLYDVGVAGLHRVLASFDALRKARALVVVAGMEGALPSVVGGLVSAPVIAVPTSIGYGAHYGGLAPLLTMLNSCVPGIAVVNIDNGFGAGYLAHVINQQSGTSR